MVEGAAATVPGAEMEGSNVLGERVICSNAGVDASDAAANVAAGNFDLSGALNAVSGAPGQVAENLAHARHPDAVSFNSAFWACVGDPNEALAAVGGG